MNIISISALADNYIWLLHNDGSQCLVCLAVHGEAASVLQALADRHLAIVAILLTHHHDHVAGVAEPLQYFLVPVYSLEKRARPRLLAKVIH
ncbi:MAG: Hydroxyacylglutathione hydrolase [Sodalis sp.]|uniref:hypothetical protein n=1 Tax=Sodalis sp. (in: enterobacteria) TaxID=1898979 RepID=UPI0038737483|nr:MAG: Hydroxyacylglutathione hydrolase [Sodalis sp.]